MQRLRTSGSSIIGQLALPQLKRKALNSWSAVQDTYYSTKDIFEGHKVVFTIATSLASIATAWGGYTLRHLHESKVEQRLDSIEKAMKYEYQIERNEFKKLVGSGSYSTATCVATAGTTLIIGYGLGWRGGKWYANRKFRKEQMKLLGQIKPKRWQLKFLRRPLIRPKSSENAAKPSEAFQKDSPVAHNSGEMNRPCDNTDGYILNMQTIPVGRSGETQGRRTPVLLQHGLVMDGITWLLSPPDQSLALILADNGFDVWISSTRGTKFSRGHLSLSPDDPAYWDWSWDELVAYDLPATFQHVHDQTGQKLHYVGHSLGTLIALASFSKGQLINMLRSAALLSPIAYVDQMTSPLARTAADNFIAEALYWLGLHEFNPRGDAVIALLKAICNKPGVDCTNLLTSFTGQNCCLNSSIVEVFLEYEPQPTSTKNMVHVAQMIRSGNITMYDYDDEGENMKHYGQPSPPVYDMASIPNDLPLFLSYGGQDAF
ncbi:Triacylglycerol lipase 2 [Camellia lanceoleosa]|uniref:Triacylglycerol lipase 2 n=1 Tax=Camellia lanceoleosa TaxID=1840588 RepID=A0ACC0H7M6_9ERIC|nr:Triacylglycerol lipase 2 [Camellia lanceoleosa]